jgi:hypothetical protein
MIWRRCPKMTMNNVAIHCRLVGFMDVKEDEKLGSSSSFTLAKTT